MKIRNATAPIENKRMLSRAEAMAYCGLGKNKLQQLATEAGAVCKYGKRVLFDKVKLDAALDKLSQGA